MKCINATKINRKFGKPRDLRFLFRHPWPLLEVIFDGPIAFPPPKTKKLQFS